MVIQVCDVGIQCSSIWGYYSYKYAWSAMVEEMVCKRARAHNCLLGIKILDGGSFRNSVLTYAHGSVLLCMCGCAKWSVTTGKAQQSFRKFFIVKITEITVHNDSLTYIGAICVDTRLCTFLDITQI